MSRTELRPSNQELLRQLCAALERGRQAAEAAAKTPQATKPTPQTTTQPTSAFSGVCTPLDPGSPQSDPDLLEAHVLASRVVAKVLCINVSTEEGRNRVTQVLGSLEANGKPWLEEAGAKLKDGADPEALEQDLTLRLTAQDKPAPAGEQPQPAPGASVSKGGWKKPRNAEELRAQVAAWCIEQAKDKNIGYSQTKGRLGNRKDANGHRYFDCSGLVYTAYKMFGVHLGGDWTGAMRATASKWAKRISRDELKPGDLILGDGHVVMYTGKGKVVGAQGKDRIRFPNQVRAGIPIARSNAIFSGTLYLRPHVTQAEVAALDEKPSHVPNIRK